MMRVRPAVALAESACQQRSLSVLSLVRPIFGGADLQNDLRQEFPGTPATTPENLHQGKLQVSQVNGVTVVSHDHQSSVATVAAIVGAGSRHETVRAPGAARVAAHMTFKKTPNRSALRFDREMVDMGVETSTTVSREQIVIAGKMLGQYSGKFTELLGDTFSNPSFAPWEVEEYKSYAQNEIADLSLNRANVVSDAIHSAAFYDTETLGNPLLSSISVSAEDVANFHAANVGTGRVTIFGAGVDHQQLVDDVQNHFALSAPSGEKKSAVYVGQESRVQGSRVTDVAIAFPVNDHAAAKVAAAILGSGSLSRSSQKFGYGSAGRLNQEVVQADNLVHSASGFADVHSDAGLLGVQAHTLGPGNSELVSIVAAQLKKLAEGVSSEECTRAKNAIKGGLLRQDSDDLKLAAIAETNALTGSVTADATEKAFAAIDAVTPEQVQKVVAEALKASPSFATVGDIADVPRHNAVAAMF